MRCLFCKSNSSSVGMSRSSSKTPSVWRRRQCNICDKLFSTREKPDLSSSLTVKKDMGATEPFSENKLLMSVYECLTHRKDALEASRAISETIVRLLLPRRDGVIKRVEIRDTALKVLKRFDRAAATYYKAHHK